MTTKCAVAGTFDPLTRGHMHIIQRAQHIFDTVLVAVHDSTKTVFSTAERCAMISDVLPHVHVMPFNGVLVDFLQHHQVKVLVRGIRNIQDWQYEQTMSRFNHDLCPNIETFFLMSDPALAHISATAVRQLAALKQSCHHYVALPVAQRLQLRYAER